MSQQDFKINAAVHSLINRRSFGTASLDFGTTNGVVYVNGSIGADGASALSHLESELRSVPGVRDVVIGIAGWRKAGTEWVRTPSTSS